MATVHAFIAVNRFGLGARPGELEAVAADPAGWLAGQIDQDPGLPVELRGLTNSAETLRGIHESRIQGPKEIRRMNREVFRKRYLDEIDALTQARVASRVPFRERMTAFWSNHFAVSGTRFTVGPMAGAYEREAIRPHIFGRFSDMLLAVVHHPVMLSYLDNSRSVGPNSSAGLRSRRGLNENLAREILELHTLGVNGGYTQTDVREFARILTGWSHGGVRTRRTVDIFGPIHGGFEFRAAAHEPGPKRLLSRTYPESGEAEGIQALGDLAHHPATARFIATKLARHFIHDDPPAPAVARLARRFAETDGDLAAVSRTLIGMEEAWAAPLPKVKRPVELVVSALRASGGEMPRRTIRLFVALGQTPWRAPSPQGWSDRGTDWISPEALMRRIEWAHAFAARLPRGLVPGEVLEASLGPVASAAMRRAVRRAPSGSEALALILASPQFQRR